jgi:hypothetical protein
MLSKTSGLATLTPHHVENTGSRVITKVKQHWAWLVRVLRWLTQQLEVKINVRVPLGLAVFRQSVPLCDKPLETHGQRIFSTEPLR